MVPWQMNLVDDDRFYDAEGARSVVWFSTANSTSGLRMVAGREIEAGAASLIADDHEGRAAVVEAGLDASSRLRRRRRGPHRNTAQVAGERTAGSETA